MDEDEKIVREPLIQGGGDDERIERVEGIKQNPFVLSMRILFLVAGLALFDLTIIIPTSAAYFAQLLFPGVENLSVQQDKDSNFYFSLSLSLFSLAQAAVGVFGGLMIKKFGFKRTIIFLLCCSIIGDSMYSIGQSFIVAVIGRTISGAGSANLGMVFTYCAVVTSSTNERNHYMSLARLASVIGLVFSPGIVFIFSYINIQVTKDYQINQLNSCGWITSLMALTLIILVVVFVKNPNRPPPPPPKSSSLEDINSSDNKLPPAAKSFMSKEVLIIFVFSFFNGYTGTTFEFITAPVTKAKYGVDPTTISLYLLGGSILSIMVILVIMKLSPRWKIVIRVGERFWMMFAFIVFAVGIVICYIGSTKYINVQPSILGEISFMAGQTICMNAYMMLSVSLLPLASKIVPPYAKETMMPWVNSCLALGRLIGPMWSNFSYSLQNTESTEILLGSVFLVLAVCITLLTLFWKRMVADVWKQNSLLHGSMKSFA